LSVTSRDGIGNCPLLLSPPVVSPVPGPLEGLLGAGGMEVPWRAAGTAWLGLRPVAGDLPDPGRQVSHLRSFWPSFLLALFPGTRDAPGWEDLG
jgi:hypothetical protein